MVIEKIQNPKSPTKNTIAKKELADSIFDSATSSMLEPTYFKISQKLKTLSFLSAIFFFLAGMASCPHSPVMVAKIDDFDAMFDIYRYKFVIMTPNYLSYPVTYIVLLFLNRGFNLKAKIIVSIKLGTVMLSLALLAALFIDNTLLSFSTMMASYFVSFSLFTCA